MQQSRARILTFAGYYLPAFRAGGPIRSIANLVGALGTEFDFRVVAYDRDLGETERFPIIDATWLQVGRAFVRYLTPGSSSAWALVKLLREEPYDLLYLQTVFDPLFGLLPLVLRRLSLAPRCPVVIAPRGQFSPGAMAIGFKKKSVYLWLVKRLLRGDETWQATASTEAAYIRRNVGDVTVSVAPNVPPAPPPPLVRPAKRRGVLRVIFLSRIARKKNLLGLLQFLEGVRGSVTIDVYGPIEDKAYWAECLVLAEALKVHGMQLTYRGLVEPIAVMETFSQYDLFFFPTHGENFGHVILEALLAGCPCLLSDQTPWHTLADSKAGWSLPLSELSEWRRVLQWCVDAGETDFCCLSNGARSYAADYLSRDESISLMRRLLMQAWGNAVED